MKNSSARRTRTATSSRLRTALLHWLGDISAQVEDRAGCGGWGSHLAAACFSLLGSGIAISRRPGDDSLKKTLPSSTPDPLAGALHLTWQAIPRAAVGWENHRGVQDGGSRRSIPIIYWESSDSRRIMSDLGPRLKELHEMEAVELVADVVFLDVFGR